MFGWGRGDRDLERALRDHRAEAPAELMQAVGDRVRAEKFRPRRGWSHLAFAAAVAVFCLGSFASFGGLSYAASGAVDTYTSVKQVVAKQKLTVSVHRSSASDQYGHKQSTPKAAKPKTNGAVKAAVAPAQGTLPFTGISLAATLVLSLMLIGLGVALRRRERRSE
jgi:hypothetical protein